MRHAVKIQEYLIQISSGDERFLSDVPTVSNARRILGVLKADQARAYELKLLKRKMDGGLDVSDPASNSLADRLQILRKYAYGFYEEAKSNGGTKLCIIQQMKLIDVYGYSPTSDRERDKAILLELGQKYINEKDDAEGDAVRRTRLIPIKDVNRIDATIPKPQEAKNYIASVLGKYLPSDSADAGGSLLATAALADEVEFPEDSSSSSAASSISAMMPKAGARAESGFVGLSAAVAGPGAGFSYADSGAGSSMDIPISYHFTHDLM